MQFFVDIEDSAGTKLGAGPLHTVIEWRYTARMDRAGSFAFIMPADAATVALVQKKRVARAFALLGSTWTEVGAGIIDSILYRPQEDGTVLLEVGGDDELRELSNRSVGYLRLASGSAGVTHSAAVASLAAVAPAGWSLTASASPGNNFVYAEFQGESVLTAAAAIAEKTQSHFYRSGRRALTFASAFTSSGVHAVRARADLTAETAAIVELEQRVDTYSMLTRIVPFGAGNGAAQLTLFSTTRTAPAGYTLNKTASPPYLQNDAAVAAYGLIDAPWTVFREIRPISNTSADIQAAADMLFDAALEQLRQLSTELEQSTYIIALSGCSTLLRPLQTLRLSYHDPDTGTSIDSELGIIESTIRVDGEGLRTTSVIVSSVDRWPASDVDTLVSNLAEGRIFEAHPQLNANSYVISYSKNLDAVQANPAQFYFRFDDEVTQLSRVTFDFQLLPLESTVTAVGLEQTTGGTISTTYTGNSGSNSAASSGTPSTADTGAASSSTTSGQTGGTDTATQTGGTGTASQTGGTATAGQTGGTVSNDNTVGLGTSGQTGGTGTSGQTGGTGTSGQTGGTTANNNTAGLGTSGQSGATGTELGGSGSTQDGGGGSTGSPTGGDTISGGRHQHDLAVSNLSNPSGGPMYLVQVGATVYIGAVGYGGSIPVSSKGNHTHGIGDHDHPINNHSHTINAHTHTIGAHSHTIDSHTHTIGTHTHTIGTHSHTIATHSHAIAAHSHTIDTHTHWIGTHAHTIGAHSHTLAGHTHGIDHTHTIAHTHDISHVHTFTPSVTMVYGVYRDSPANVFAVTDLEYTLDGSTWYGFSVGVNGFATLGSGWNRIDLTTLLQDPQTLRPISSNNLLRIRRKTAGASKMATIDAQLTIRNIIQAIAYT